VGGNVLDLVALMENCSIRAAAWRLTERALTRDNIRSSNGSSDSQQPPTKNGELPFQLRGIINDHPYLVQRGLTKETAETFGMGYFPGRGVFSGRVVIPIHNMAGKLVAYAGRSLDGRQPKYLFPRGFRKKNELFNLHRIAAEEVILVEGFFDCM